MSTLVHPGVEFKAVPPPIVRMRDVLAAVATGGRPVVPGLPDQLVILSVSERTMGVESRGFANVACRQQFVWEVKERLGPLFDVFLEGENTPREQFVLRRKVGP
jgi:hypothetical protein